METIDTLDGATTSRPPQPTLAKHRNPKRPLIVRLGKRFRFVVNRIVIRYSVVEDAPVLDRAQFPWLLDLERAAPQIRAEADTILGHLNAVPPMNEMSPDHRRIAGDGGWRAFFLYAYGYRIGPNCVRCPETVKALAKIPGLVTAMYSVLEPGMHVGRHRGVSKGILICHLGLRVPIERQSCHMDVDGHEVLWTNNETHVFDDTYPHEVWNDTDEFRTILLVQFRRPMRLVGRVVAGLFIWAVKHSPYLQDGLRNVDHWENILAASERSKKDRRAQDVRVILRRRSL